MKTVKQMELLTSLGNKKKAAAAQKGCSQKSLNFILKTVGQLKSVKRKREKDSEES